MGDNGKNGKAHKDPHRDLHAASGGTHTDRPGNRSETPMNASGVTPGGKEPSMGGSQGTRAEARNETRGDKHRDSESSRSASNREGGYGADSGYSDDEDRLRDHSRSAKSNKRPDSNSDRSRSK